jgi:hypothetical protein
MSHELSLQAVKEWVQSAVSLESQGTESVGWKDLLGPEGLGTLAVCLSDLHDHCENVVSHIDQLMGGAPGSDSLDELLAQVEVQLALAVRNWRELANVLRENESWRQAETFESLSEPD